MEHLTLLCMLQIHIIAVFQDLKTFVRGKPEPLCSTQNSDRFVTYHERFNMTTGQPNSQSNKNYHI